ncbi:TPR repeat containing exported protein [Labilithrix luteola]|uniref:TPR repeat containing exported protein n=1 Tax=Labilithrix luteola TaxID=1391654 RepID=A0A0K1PYA9_9BACT|nr:TPR repeat containing exported protein [Labilithrix luteola]
MVLPSRWQRWLGFGVILSASASGCAHESAETRQMAEMRETITRIQGDRDRMDQRLGALEVAMAEEKGAREKETASRGAAPPAAPPPRTVSLGAGEATHESDDPNDTSARPEIRVVGVPGANSRNARGKSRRNDDGDVSALRAEGRSSALDPDAKKAYENGLSQVQGKQYDRGLETLTAFLVRWPDHPYAENAMYWRGEAYYAQGEYLRAAEQFEAVLARFAGGSKAPDALLKLGLCHDRLGGSARAREYWDRLKNEYPRSDAVKKIPSPSRETGARGAAAPRSDESSTKGPKESR